VDQKQPSRALDVLERVLATGRSVHLVVSGDGPRRDELEADARTRGLTDHLAFLGHRRDVDHVLGAIDILLLTSDVEGIPGVAIEAQMAGCPVITFPLGRVADVVEHGTTGVVLDATDVDAMADAVVHLIDDPDLRDKMSRRARERSVEFSTDRVARRYAEHLLGLVEPDPDAVARRAPGPS
jgi:glycosyltransferase involved in cell wall biosynthesis